MKTFFPLLLALVLIIGCTTPGSVGVTPRPATSDYFVTKSGGFALKLDEQRKIASCRYSLLLMPRQTVSHPLYLRTRFDNPADANSPLVTDTDVQSGSGDIHISSDDVRGLQSHLNYKAEVLVFDSPDRVRQIGKHVQYVRYTQPSFIKASPQGQIPGHTLVNGSPSLRRDAVRAVATYEMALSPYKGALPVLDTQIIEAPDRISVDQPTDLVQARWIERWVIQRGSTNFAYRVLFDAQGSRGTDITVGIDSPDFMKGPVDVIDIK